MKTLIDCVTQAPGWTGDRNELKTALVRAVGPRTLSRAHEPAYQFSTDPCLDLESPLIRVRFDGHVIPEGFASYCSMQPVSLPSNGEHVLLSLWGGIRGRATRSRPTSSGDIAQDYRRRFATCLDIHHVEAGKIITREVRSRASGGFVIVYAHIRVNGIVGDADALAEILHRGIGPSQAYGLGLVHVASHQDIPCE